MQEVWYATLAQARAEVREHDPAVTAGNPYILQALAHVSARIDRHAELTYAPLLDTRYLDGRGDHIDDMRGELFLDFPALAITSVTVGGTVWTADTDYRTQPRGRTPINALRVPFGIGRNWDDGSGDWIDNVEVTGIWGYHRQYASAFVESNDAVQDNPLTSSAKTITVTSFDATSQDAAGRSPRFSAGQLLRLEDELVLVVDTPSNTQLTVLRGVRGSSSASHLQNTKIAIFTPEPTIERACLRWVSYLYKRRGQFETVVTTDGFTTTKFPPDVPEEVQGILDEMPTFYTWGAV